MICATCHDEEHVKRTLKIEGNADTGLEFRVLQQEEPVLPLDGKLQSVTLAIFLRNPGGTILAANAAAHQPSIRSEL